MPAQVSMSAVQRSREGPLFSSTAAACAHDLKIFPTKQS